MAVNYATPKTNVKPAWPTTLSTKLQIYVTYVRSKIVLDVQPVMYVLNAMVLKMYKIICVFHV